MSHENVLPRQFSINYIYHMTYCPGSWIAVPQNVSFMKRCPCVRGCRGWCTQHFKAINTCILYASLVNSTITCLKVLVPVNAVLCYTVCVWLSVNIHLCFLVIMVPQVVYHNLYNNVQWLTRHTALVCIVPCLICENHAFCESNNSLSFKALYMYIQASKSYACRGYVHVLCPSLD